MCVSYTIVTLLFFNYKPLPGEHRDSLSRAGLPRWIRQDLGLIAFSPGSCLDFDELRNQGW